MTTSQVIVARVKPILNLLERMGLKERVSDLEDLILAYQESIATSLRLEATIHGMVKAQEKPARKVRESCSNVPPVVK